MNWTWWGVPGTLALLVGVVAAVIALRTAPQRVLNQRLATVLLLDGVFVGCGGGLLFFFESRQAVVVVSIIATTALVALPFQYLAFLGAALDSRLVASFRSRRALLALDTASAAAVAAVLMVPHRFVTAPYSPGWAPWNYQNAELAKVASQLYGVVALFALAAAISVFMRTRPGSAARSHARWFIIAFGVRDVYGMVFYFFYPQIRPIAFWGDLIYNPLQSSLYLVFLLLLTYGVLHTQLLNIELKVKLALERSTVFAVIAAAFLIGSEALESLVPVHSTIIGLGLAFGVAVALRPLERVAKRLVDRIMPGVERTPVYFETRRLEVYRAALESAALDGIITEREHAILASLRTKLGITNEEAALAERGVQLNSTNARRTAVKRIAV